MNEAGDSQRHQQSREELENHLQDQISFLESSARSFDDGYEGESKRIATAVRVLLHDTKKSKSLLSQLDLKGIDFWDTSGPLEKASLTSHSGLVVSAMNSQGASYHAFLDDGFSPPNKVSFEHWWNQIVFVDTAKRTLSRRDLVLVVANQDGGTHVDPSLDTAYADLSRNNSLGWTFQHDGGPTVDLKGPEKAALRQVCHEVLKALIPNYQQQPSYPENSVVFGGMQMIEVAEHPPGSESKLCSNDSGVSLVHQCNLCS